MKVTTPPAAAVTFGHGVARARCRSGWARSACVRS